MRSADYTKPTKVYHEYNLQEKLRAALVEGMSHQYPAKKRLLYKNLVKQFIGLDNKERVETFFKFLSKNPNFRNQKHEMFLDYLVQFEPIDGIWQKIPKDEMIKQGVLVVSKSTNIEDLLKDINETPQNKIIKTDLDILGDSYEVYSKRIPQSKILLLNGKRVIKQFAEGKIDLSKFPSFQKRGYISKKFYKMLQNKDFTFPAAVISAIEYLQSEKGRKFDLAVFAVKMPSGDYRYIFPKDIPRGDEFNAELMCYRANKIKIEHESKKEKEESSLGLEGPYVEIDVYIPRMLPTEDKVTNMVNMRYLPNAKRDRNMILEWFRQLDRSDSNFSRDFRNREHIKGMSSHNPEIDDFYARAALLYVTNKYGLSNSQIIYSTNFSIRLLDKIRFNLHQPNPAKQTVSRQLFNGGLKEFEDCRMLQLTPLSTKELLKPMYSGLEN